MKRSYVRNPLRWAAGLLCMALASAVLAQVDIDFTLADVTGAPSRIAMRHGTRQVTKAKRRAAQADRARQEQVRQYRSQVRRKLARLPAAKAPKPALPPKASRGVKPIQPTRKSGRPPKRTGPPRTAPPSPPVPPLQNLQLTFVTPDNGPVAGLRLSATAHTRDGRDVRLASLSTDAQGRAKLVKVGPLPAAVDLDVSPEQQGEWRFRDADSASLLLDRPRGTRIAERRPVMLASRVPIRLAARPATVTVYDGQEPRAIVMERSVVDLEIAAPPGARVTTAALSDTELTVPEDGRLRCRLPQAALTDGPVPIRVAEVLPGGEAETLIEQYPADPYRKNEVACPPLRLVRLRDVRVAADLGAMDERAAVERAIGKPKRQRGRPDPVVKLDDGSQIWTYPSQGLSLKMRTLPFREGRSDRMVLERIRLVSPDGGSVAGLSVGSDASDVVRALGAPDGPAADPASDGVDTYLERGVRIARQAGKVEWIELGRPPRLLTEGTTAFVAPRPARLLVRSFAGNERTALRTAADLRAYLGQVHAVRLVDRPEDADLELSAAVTGFEEEKGEVTDVIPYKYACTTRIQYSLYDADAGRYVVRDKEASFTAKADYTAEAAGAGLLSGYLLSRKSTALKILGGVLGLGSVVELNRSVRRAVNRCPAISERGAFNQMVADITRAADFTVRVTDIDYGKGLLTLNVGEDAGIGVSTSSNPYEFEILVAGQALPGGDDSQSKEVYSAAVVQVEKDRCVCELRRVSWNVRRSRESVESRPDPAMARRIPDPATGLVAARAWLRFPDVNVITEEDMRALEAAGDK